MAKTIPGRDFTKVRLMTNLVRRCRLTSSVFSWSRRVKSGSLRPEETGLLVMEATIGITTCVEKGNKGKPLKNTLF